MYIYTYSYISSSGPPRILSFSPCTPLGMNQNEGAKYKGKLDSKHIFLWLNWIQKCLLLIPQKLYDPFVRFPFGNSSTPNFDT